MVHEQLYDNLLNCIELRAILANYVRMAVVQALVQLLVPFLLYFLDKAAFLGSVEQYQGKQNLN